MHVDRDFLYSMLVCIMITIVVFDMVVWHNISPDSVFLAATIVFPFSLFFPRTLCPGSYNTQTDTIKNLSGSRIIQYHEERHRWQNKHGLLDPCRMEFVVWFFVLAVYSLYHQWWLGLFVAATWMPIYYIFIEADATIAGFYYYLKEARK